MEESITKLGQAGFMIVCVLVYCLCWGFTAQSTQWGHVERMCLGLTTRQPLWIILYRLPEKGRKKVVEEIKEIDREERGTGMKGKKQMI